MKDVSVRGGCGNVIKVCKSERANTSMVLDIDVFGCVYYVHTWLQSWICEYAYIYYYKHLIISS